MVDAFWSQVQLPPAPPIKNKQAAFWWLFYCVCYPCLNSLELNLYPGKFMLFVNLLFWRKLFRIIQARGRYIYFMCSTFIYIRERCTAFMTKSSSCVVRRLIGFGVSFCDNETFNWKREPCNRLRTTSETTIITVAYSWTGGGGSHFVANHTAHTSAGYFSFSHYDPLCWFGLVWNLDSI